jgi:uncharacterized protein (DUF1684 family)
MFRAFVIILVALSLAGMVSYAQSYTDSIVRWQHEYKAEFLSDPRSPVKAADTGFIRFYPVNERWRVVANVVPTPEAKTFDMATHSGKTKRFRSWASLRFANPVSRGVHYYTLVAYERVDPPKGDTISPVTLFIPFNDETNLNDTYGGGRYMDIPKAAVKGGYLILDFNKAYNPYCAFGEGFSCPIPPIENKLPVEVRAGEMVWAKKANGD